MSYSKRPGRTIQGIRAIPPGYAIGRPASAPGKAGSSAQLVSIAEIGQGIGGGAPGGGNTQVQGLQSIPDGDILSNITGGAGIPVGNTLTAILDHVLGSAQGDLIYRNASTWVVLPPGTSGQFLETLGAGANIAWATIPADTDTLATLTDVNLSGLANNNLLWYQTSDSKWHNATLSAILDGVLGSTQGMIIYRDGVSGWIGLAPGASGTLLRSSGSGANITWGTHLTEDGTKFIISYNSGTIAGSLIGGTKLWLSPGDGSGAKLVIDGYSDNPGVDFRLSLGTGASPSAITTGLQMGIFASRGWDGSVWSNRSSGFGLATTENWNTTSHGSKIQLFVTKNGTVSLVEAADINQDGGITLNTSAGVAPTGGSKGPGTINASAADPLFINGTTYLDSQLGSTIDAVAFRGSTGWTSLNPGTSGQFLQTKGSGSDPVWATPTGGSGGGLYSPVLSTLPTQAGTGFTSWYRQGSATVADMAMGVAVFCPNQGSTNKITAITKASAGSGTAKKYRALIARTGNPAGFSGPIFGWSDGTKAHVVGLNGSSTDGLTVHTWTNSTTYGSNLVTMANFPQSFVWLQLWDDGTNIVFQFSQDGVNFITIYTIARASGFLGSAGYTNIIFGGNAFDVDMYASLLSYQEI